MITTTRAIRPAWKLGMFKRPEAIEMWRYRPRQLAVAYLVGTFLTFLIIGRSDEVPDLVYLVTFIAATICAIAIGYAARVSYGASVKYVSPDKQKVPTRLIVACAIYFVALGGSLLTVAGVSDISSIMNALANPGGAYFDRLHSEKAANSVLIQIVTLGSGFYPLLVPLAIFHWGKLDFTIKLLIAVGIGTYAAYFVSIGTMKGLGDLFIFAAASHLAKRASDSVANGDRNIRSMAPKQRALMWIMAILFIGYMTFNQADRTKLAGQEAMFPTNPLVASVIGENLARGVASSLVYPVHGYLGLSYNLETPFVWTNGLGGSPAVGSYWNQYTGGDDRTRDRYTARTEKLSGWPDGMYWSTLYPWLASDLTYPGAILFMGLVGWFLAKFWQEAVLQRRTLSMALFCQLALLLAFVPANNQIGQVRASLIAFATTAGLSLAQRIRDSFDYRRPFGINSASRDRDRPAGPVIEGRLHANLPL